jgi:hypothetical protein
LNKVLEINKSQIKALDYLGLLKEHQTNYSGACSDFEKAWEYSCKSNANIG